MKQSKGSTKHVIAPFPLPAHAPVSREDRQQLRKDAADVYAAAARKQLRVSDREALRDTRFAQQHFELGCWLFHLRHAIRTQGPAGQRARIECAVRLLLADITYPGDDFFTVFDFGQREYDTLFESGDDADVIRGMEAFIPTHDTKGTIRRAVQHLKPPTELAA